MTTATWSDPTQCLDDMKLTDLQKRLLRAFTQCGMCSVGDLKKVSPQWLSSLGKLMPKFVEQYSSYYYVITEKGTALRLTLPNA